MFEKKNNSSLKLVLCNPDLGLKGWRDLSPFTPKTIQIKLQGQWKQDSHH